VKEKYIVISMAVLLSSLFLWTCSSTKNRGLSPPSSPTNTTNSSAANATSSPPSSSVDASEQSLLPSDRKELIARLEANGDRAVSKEDTRSAYWIYRFAALYAPANPKILGKKKKVSSPGYFTTEEGMQEVNRATDAVQSMPTEAFANWPKTTLKMEVVELQILLDDNLTGRLRCKGMVPKSTPEKAIYLILDEPKMSLSAVRSKYGKPSTEKRDGEWTILTYGRIRIMADSSDKVAFVVYQGVKALL
jgi:hypothetical protein